MRSALFCLAMVLTVPVLAGGQPDAPEPGRKSAPPPSRHQREQAVREYLQRISPEQRKKVLAAVRSVWQEPDVVAAREELRQSVETYKAAMREAVAASDPEVREIVQPMVERLVRDGLSPDSLRGGGDPPLRYLRALGITPAAYHQLPAQERRLLLSARRSVLQSDAVREKQAAFVSAEPSRRSAARSELQQAAREAARQHDPQIGPILERLPPP